MRIGKDDFYACNLIELQKYKKQYDLYDLIENSLNFINYVKEIFPANQIPQDIAFSLFLLEQRIDILKKQYEISVENVCEELKKMIDKGCLK